MATSPLNPNQSAHTHISRLKMPISSLGSMNWNRVDVCSVSEVRCFISPVNGDFMGSFSFPLLRFKGQRMSHPVKPYETNWELYIRAIQIKYNWLIELFVTIVESSWTQMQERGKEAGPIKINCICWKNYIRRRPERKQTSKLKLSRKNKAG